MFVLLLLSLCVRNLHNMCVDVGSSPLAVCFDVKHKGCYTNTHTLSHTHTHTHTHTHINKMDNMTAPKLRIKVDLVN